MGLRKKVVTTEFPRSGLVHGVISLTPLTETVPLMHIRSLAADARRVFATVAAALQGLGKR
jgi:hypothetical protein